MASAQGVLSGFSMDKLYDYEIPIIKQFQNEVDKTDLGPTMQTVSRIGDPGLVFIFYFPIILGLNFKSGIKYLGVAVICEWSNMILKWLLFGERPYWWIKESPTFTHPNSKITLNQNPMTCETGPGCPSGHVMANVVLWLVLYDVLVNKVVLNNFDKTSFISIVLKRLLWIGFLFTQIMIVVSRIYNLNHFPHQCMLAFVCSMIILQLFYYSDGWTKMRSRLVAVILALCILGTGIGTYQYLHHIGKDPDWSINKALKWCLKRSWVYLDTTPFVALARISGAAMGLALGATATSGRGEIGRSDDSYIFFEQLFRALLGALSGGLAMLVHKFLPKEDLRVFYGLEFVLNMVFVLFVLLAVPGLSRAIFKTQLPSEKARPKKNSRKVK